MLRWKTDKGGSRPPVTTAADGAFTLYTPPGKIRVEVAQSPDDYVQPLLVGDNRRPQSDFAKVDADKDVVWPTIRLERAARLEGIVVDESGKPAADAEVEYLASRGAYADLAVVPTKTDADGTFTIRGLRPKETMAIRARTGRAVSDVAELRPAEATSPVRLTLSPKRVFVIRGVCVDTAGRPLPHAKATVSGVWMLGSTGLSFGGGHCETDADGRFEFPNLWPGFHYQVTVAAKGYEQIESPQLQSQPGADPRPGPAQPCRRQRIGRGNRDRFVRSSAGRGPRVQRGRRPESAQHQQRCGRAIPSGGTSHRAGLRVRGKEGLSLYGRLHTSEQHGREAATASQR